MKQDVGSLEKSEPRRWTLDPLNPRSRSEKPGERGLAFCPSIYDLKYKRTTDTAPTAASVNPPDFIRFAVLMIEIVRHFFPFEKAFFATVSWHTLEG